MRICISAKNFSPVLTKLAYKKEENCFVWTDSFLLVEYTPWMTIPADDFFVEYPMIWALEKLLWSDPDASVSFRWMEATQNDQILIHMLAWKCDLYIPIIKDKFPNHKQMWLFWQASAEASELMLNSSMKKFHRVCQVIEWWSGSSPVVKINKDVYEYEHTDEMWWKYRVLLRRPVKG